MNFLRPMVPAPAVRALSIVRWGVDSLLYGDPLRYTQGAKDVALTFDDGPNPAVTPRLLDLFDRYSVRATFFLIGKFTRACPDLVNEISARGHLVGNHTDTHANLIFKSRGGIYDELAR